MKYIVGVKYTDSTVYYMKSNKDKCLFTSNISQAQSYKNKKSAIKRMLAFKPVNCRIFIMEVELIDENNPFELFFNIHIKNQKPKIIYLDEILIKMNMELL